MIHESVKKKFLKKLQQAITANLGKHPQQSEAYTRIINQKHFKRLRALIDDEKVVYGGITDAATNYIAPTVMDHVSFDDAVMQEEIFGPVLPVLTFSDTTKMIGAIKRLPKPLALYVFSKNKKESRRVVSEIPFGGGAVNDTIMHLTNPHLPFGGVNNSGTGSYHGKAGFDAFSHHKSILRKSTLFEPFVKYPPYTRLKWKLLKWLLE
jgi:aldehyde dehydrogenase (NAD+)